MYLLYVNWAHYPVQFNVIMILIKSNHLSDPIIVVLVDFLHELS